MNGKQAKRLRKAAIGFAAVLDEAGHKIDSRGYELSKRARAKTYDAEIVLNRKDTLRGIYRTFKKGVVDDKLFNDKQLRRHEGTYNQDAKLGVTDDSNAGMESRPDYPLGPSKKRD